MVANYVRGHVPRGALVKGGAAAKLAAYTRFLFFHMNRKSTSISDLQLVFLENVPDIDFLGREDGQF
jgi:hypothetical protein